MTADEARTLIRSIMPPIHEMIGAQIAKAVAPLEQRVVDGEAGRLEYTGVWEAREYRRGQIVTSDGGMWFCKARTRTEPPGDAWQLCVKAGRPGRDAR